METLAGSALICLQKIYSYDIGRLEGCLCAKCGLLLLRKFSISSTIRCIFIRWNDTTNLVVILAKHASDIRGIGRTVLVV